MWSRDKWEGAGVSLGRVGEQPELELGEVFLCIPFYDCVLQVNTVSLGTNPSRFNVVFKLSDREV